MRAVFGLIMLREQSSPAIPPPGLPGLRRLDGQTKEYVQIRR